MSSVLLYAADLVAVLFLTLGIYFPRHHRRDLVSAYIGVNVGVLAVSAVLADNTVAAGLGLGLFGVLSIIRLRSTELEQDEVAYYFSALALGLLGGLGADDPVLPLALMALILVAMFLAGHPRMFQRHRHQMVVLDSAYTDEAQLTAHLEGLLGAQIKQVTVQRVDLVNDTTLVDVRFRVTGQGRLVTRSAEGFQPVVDPRVHPSVHPSVIPAADPVLPPEAPVR